MTEETGAAPAKSETVYSGAVPAIYSGEDRQAAPPSALELEESARRQREFMVRVFGLMFVGLLITAAMAYSLVFHPDYVEFVRRNPIPSEILLVAEMIGVALIVRGVEQWPLALLRVLFPFYAAANGITFSVFFAIFEPEAVALSFLLTGLAFGAAFAYGRISDFDPGSLRSIGYIAAAGLGGIAALNLLWGNGSGYWAMTITTFVTFMSLTAHHSQYIRSLSEYTFDDDERGDKASLVGALLLYLDFVNLFIVVVQALRVWARKREN